MKEVFNIGKIVNSHGVKGEVKIYPYTDDAGKFEFFSYLLIEGKNDKKFEIESARVHKNMVLLKFKSFDNINEILEFKDKNVYVYREDIEDDSDGHYIVDLIGCLVVNEDGHKIGELLDVLQNTAQDLYMIKKFEDSKIFYLPVVDEFVKNIDIKNKVITIKLIEGLIE